MFRSRTPVADDASEVVALATALAASADADRRFCVEAQAFACFFDRTYPLIDCIQRRLLRATAVDFDSLAALAIEEAFTLMLDQVSGREALPPQTRERTISICAALAATRVALGQFAKQIGQVGPNAGEGQSLGSSSLGQLRAVLADMPRSEAELVILVDLFEYSPSELGRVLGGAEWRVMARLERGRRRLRQRSLVRRTGT